MVMDDRDDKLIDVVLGASFNDLPTRTACRAATPPSKTSRDACPSSQWAPCPRPSIMKRWNDGQHRHDGLKPPIFGGCLPYADSRRTVSWARLQRRVPPLELGHRGVMVDRTVIEPVFQHVLVCAADLRAGSDAEDGHDLIAVDIRPDGVEVLFSLRSRTRCSISPWRTRTPSPCDGSEWSRRRGSAGSAAHTADRRP